MRKTPIPLAAAALWWSTFSLSSLLPAVALAGPPSGAPGPKAPEQPIAANLTVREIAKDTFVVSHAYPWPSNSLLLKMADGRALLVDTPYTPEATELLLRWADEQVKPKSYLAINTHYHVDRLGGNGALRARHIPIYGSRQTAALLRERGESSRKLLMGWITDPAVRARFSSLDFIAPDHLFDQNQGLRLSFGPEAIEVFYPGPGHTPDNLMVHVPSRRLLFGGCFVLGQEKLGNMTEANVEAWLKGIRSMRGRDAVLVVPGHGGASDGFSRHLLEKTESLLAESQKAGAQKE